MIAVGDITHYLGDAICLVAAKTPEALAQAKALVADIVSNYISDVFAKQISAEEAMEIANEEVAEVYREAGYIS